MWKYEAKSGILFDFFVKFERLNKFCASLRAAFLPILTAAPDRNASAAKKSRYISPRISESTPGHWVQIVDMG